MIVFLRSLDCNPDPRVQKYCDYLYANNINYRIVCWDRSCKLKTGVCANCDIYEYCYGGCPFVAESTHGTIYAKDNTCAAQRKIVHYIKEYLMRYKKQ